MNVKGSWKNCTLISQGQFPFKKKKNFQRALQMCKLTKKWPLLATWSTRTRAFISQEENIPENSANIHCSLENFLLWKKKKSDSPERYPHHGQWGTATVSLKSVNLKTNCGKWGQDTEEQPTSKEKGSERKKKNRSVFQKKSNLVKGKIEMRLMWEQGSLGWREWYEGTEDPFLSTLGQNCLLCSKQKQEVCLQLCTSWGVDNKKTFCCW